MKGAIRRTSRVGFCTGHLDTGVEKNKAQVCGRELQEGLLLSAVCWNECLLASRPGAVTHLTDGTTWSLSSWTMLAWGRTSMSLETEGIGLFNALYHCPWLSGIKQPCISSDSTGSHSGHFLFRVSSVGVVTIWGRFCPFRAGMGVSSCQRIGVGEDTPLLAPFPSLHLTSLPSGPPRLLVPQGGR